MKLSSKINKTKPSTGLKERRISQPSRLNYRIRQQIKEQTKRKLRVRALGKAPNDSVPNENVWVLDASEKQISVVDVAVGGGGGEGEEAAGGEVVFGLAGFGELGMQFFKVLHGSALGF